MNSVKDAVGGKVRPDSDDPGKPYTTARLPLDVAGLCTGMACAQRFALAVNLVDITQPFADAIPPYIPGNIQYYGDQRDHEPYPSWYFLVDFNNLGK